MSLPNPGMDAVPFTPLTAEFLDNMIENIESLADGTGFDAGAIGTTDIAAGAVTAAKTTGIWWEELGRTTLGTAGDTITVSGLSTRKYLQIRIMALSTGGNTNVKLRFNSDTGTNYSLLSSVNNAAQSSNNSQTSLSLEGNVGNWPHYGSVEVIDVSTNEKAIVGHLVALGNTGGSNPTGSTETFGKWANSSSAISSVTIFNDSTGDYAIGSEVVVLGHN